MLLLAGGIAESAPTQWPCWSAGGVAKERLTPLAVLRYRWCCYERVKTVGRVAAAQWCCDRARRAGGGVEAPVVLL